MRSTKTGLVPLAIAAVVGLPLATAGVAHAGHESEEGVELAATLEEINDSGASGTAWASVSYNEVTVKLQTEGLLDGAPHAQHIHIGGENVCPPADLEGSGFEGAIQTSDGLPSYGGIAVTLTKEGGSTGPEHGLDVADFPAEGSYTYERTIEVDDAVAADIAAGDGVIVVHGVDHNGSGTYDGDVMSDLDPSLPSEATDPALCGELEQAQMNMPEDGVATGGGATSGTENTGLIALGAAALGAGALGLAATRRRGATQS